MEIIDYLHIARRRWWILVAVPVLAGLAAVALILSAPASYTSTATVSSGSLVNSDGSPFAGTQATSQFVAAFTAAAQNPQTRQAVQSETGVRVTDQADGIEVDPVGASSDIQVIFTSGDRRLSGLVAQATAREALKQMFTVRANQAVATRDKAQQAATEANAAISALAKKYQIADPPRAYQNQLAQVASLQQQQATLKATGNAIGAAAMDAPIATAKKELTAFLPILAEYNDLSSRQVAANSDLAQAQAEWRHALALQAAATSDGTVYLGPTSAVDKQATLVATLPVIVGVGLFLAVLLILVLELVQRLHRRRDASSAGPAAVQEPLHAEEEEIPSAPSTSTASTAAGAGPLNGDLPRGADSAMSSRIDDPEVSGRAEQEAEAQAARSRV
jgi:capsular polysaccharide biosynthesis protein